MLRRSYWPSQGYMLFTPQSFWPGILLLTPKRLVCFPGIIWCPHTDSFRLSFFYYSHFPTGCLNLVTRIHVLKCFSIFTWKIIFTVVDALTLQLYPLTIPSYLTWFCLWILYEYKIFFSEMTDNLIANCLAHNFLCYVQSGLIKLDFDAQILPVCRTSSPQTHFWYMNSCLKFLKLTWFSIYIYFCFSCFLEFVTPFQIL